VPGCAGSRQHNYQIYTQIRELSDEEFIDLVEQGVFM